VEWVPVVASPALAVNMVAVAAAVVSEVDCVPVAALAECMEQVKSVPTLATLTAIFRILPP